MKKIAVLINEDTMQRCSCGGCLGAVYAKKDAFREYGEAGEEIQLVVFTHSGGDLDKKIQNMLKKEVDAVHLSSCTKTKNPEYYETLVARLSEHFPVVGYTHGTREGAEREALFIAKQETK